MHSIGDFRQFLKRKMYEKGFHQKSLALAAGLNATAVRDIFVGRSRNPTIGTLTRLATTLGYDSVEEMLAEAQMDDGFTLADRDGGIGPRPPEKPMIEGVDFAGFLQKKLAQKGWRAKSLSRASGINELTIRKVLRNDGNATMRTLTKIAHGLDYPTVEAMLAEAKSARKHAPGPDYAYPQRAAAGGVQEAAYTGRVWQDRQRKESDFSPNIPVFSPRLGDNTLDLRAPSGEVLRHPNQYGSPGAFAVYMPDDSMEPRYHAGELIYLDPRKVPALGRDCLVALKSGEIFIAQFDGLQPALAALRRFKPAEALKVKRTDIENLYAVVGRGD